MANFISENPYILWVAQQRSQTKTSSIHAAVLSTLRDSLLSFAHELEKGNFSQPHNITAKWKHEDQKKKVKSYNCVSLTTTCQLFCVGCCS